MLKRSAIDDARRIVAEARAALEGLVRVLEKRGARPQEPGALERYRAADEAWQKEQFAAQQVREFLDLAHGEAVAGDGDGLLDGHGVVGQNGMEEQ